MQVVPFTSDYDQQFKTTLNGVNYVIDARWNERWQMWTFDLTDDASSTLLVAGVPLLVGVDVLSPYALGIGGILVADLSGLNSDAGPDDFSGRVVPIYLTPDELAILYAAGVPGIVSPGPAQAPQGATPAGGSSSSSSQSSSSNPGGGTTQQGTTVVNTVVNSLTLIGGGFGSDQVRPDSSGNEVLAYQRSSNVGLNPNATVKAIAQFIAEGSGTIRIYLGGTLGTIGDVGTPSGTLVGSAAAPGSVGFAFISGTPISNPGGIIPVKITIQSAAPGTNVQVDSWEGAVG